MRRYTSGQVGTPGVTEVVSVGVRDGAGEEGGMSREHPLHPASSASDAAHREHLSLSLKSRRTVSVTLARSDWHN